MFEENNFVSLSMQTFLFFKFFVTKALAPIKQSLPTLTILPTVAFRPTNVFSPISLLPPIFAPEVIHE